jgi:hypothetical protein
LRSLPGEIGRRAPVRGNFVAASARFLELRKEKPPVGFRKSLPDELFNCLFYPIWRNRRLLVAK